MEVAMVGFAACKVVGRGRRCERGAGYSETGPSGRNKDIADKPKSIVTVRRELCVVNI